MTLNELAIVLDTTLEVKWNEPRSVFHVSLRNVEEKDDQILKSIYGIGITVDAAKQNYAQQLGGKRLVIHARHLSRRKEITAPPTITSE